MLINGMNGLGDNIYQRAFVSRLKGRVMLRTPWPELYADIPHLQFVNPHTSLRTQSKNVSRYARWVQPLYGIKTVNVSYGAEGIRQGMARSFGFQPGQLSLPNFGAPLIDRPYVVVRPVTVRREWIADSRNPDPEYVNLAAVALAQAGYTVVSIADLAEGQEWAVGALPFAHLRYHSGELCVEQLVNLVANASAVVGGVGWLVPAAIAAKVPAWIVCGGQGGYNSPDKISFEPGKLTFAVPENFCMCREKTHACDKRIHDYESKLAGWVRGLPAVV